MFKDLEADIVGIETLHNECNLAVNLKTDANQLLKFKDMYLQ
jgi:hypothetical protein